MGTKFAETSADDERGRRWIVAAVFGGLVLVYVAYAVVFYEIIVAIF